MKLSYRRSSHFQPVTGQKASTCGSLQYFNWLTVNDLDTNPRSMASENQRLCILTEWCVVSVWLSTMIVTLYSAHFWPVTGLNASAVRHLYEDQASFNIHFDFVTFTKQGSKKFLILQHREEEEEMVSHRITWVCCLFMWQLCRTWIASRQHQQSESPGDPLRPLEET